MKQDHIGVAQIVAVLATLAIAVSVVVVMIDAPSLAQSLVLEEEAGDVDCDGELTIADALALVTVAAGSLDGSQSCVAVGVSGANLARGDLDGDGLASVADALIVAQCSAGLWSVQCPPAPAIARDLGDVNCDGVLDSADRRALAAWLQDQLSVTGSRCVPGDDRVIDAGRADITRNGVLNRADEWQIELCLQAYAAPSRIRKVEACPRTGTEAPASVGDVNCDGVVTTNDGQAIADYAAGSRSGLQACVGGPAVGEVAGAINLARSDVNGDGVVDGNDAATLLTCIADLDPNRCPRSVWPPRTRLPTPDYGSPLHGDVNCDGFFDDADATAAYAVIASDFFASSTCETDARNPGRGDIDRDGELTIEDVGLIYECVNVPEIPLCPAANVDRERRSPAMGDIDCDGVRTTADVELMRRLVRGTAFRGFSCPLGTGEQVNVVRADLNNDGFATEDDLLLLERCVADPTGARCPARSCGAADAVPAECVHDQRVLSIRFLPRDPAAPDLLDPWAVPDREVAEGQTFTIDEIRAGINGSEAAALGVLQNSTRYRGYENPDAVASMTFTIMETVDLYERPPIGRAYVDTFRPDYQQILTRDDIDVCSWVDDQGIDEVWMWSMHTERIEPAESNMSSRSSLPFIDVSNSERSDDLPHCGRTYVVYNYNFRSAEPNMLHNRGHHMEGLLKWRNADRQVFLYDGYVGEGDRYEQLVAPLGFYRCGNVHRAVNSPALELPGQPEENTWVDRTVQSDCATWTRTGGVSAAVNCSAWYVPYWDTTECFADGGVSWVTWWFQNLPGLGNGMIDDGRQWRNVFDGLGDPDGLLRSGSLLFETEEVVADPEGGGVLAGNTHFVRHPLRPRD